MSIISEALKKATQSRSLYVRATENSRIPKQKFKSSRSVKTIPWVVMSVFLVVFTGILAYPVLFQKSKGSSFFQSLQNRLSASQHTEKPELLGVSRSQYALEEKPLFMSSDSPPFSLSGIAQFQDGFVAVVNGQIVKKGDMIRGSKVLAITSRAVELDHEGQRIILEKTF